VKLIPLLRKLRDGPQGPLRDRRPADHVGQGENVLLDVRREPEHAHDLRHPGAGDPLAAGDLGLVADSARFEEGLPLEGLAEKLDDPPCLPVKNFICRKFTAIATP
jgi:hypothetical protein